MEVAVLGHRGMLGSVVARYFTEQGATVHTTDLRYGEALIEWCAGRLVINCIAGDTWSTLSALPHELAGVATLIQPSTDAYREETDYARLKRQGEPPNAIVARCGLIDVTKPLRFGYTNWECNPLTPLEWAKWAFQKTADSTSSGTVQLGRELTTRYAVAANVAALWGYEPPKPVVASRSLDRFMVDTTKRPKLAAALREYRAWLHS